LNECIEISTTTEVNNEIRLRAEEKARGKAATMDYRALSEQGLTLETNLTAAILLGVALSAPTSRC
jgi:hypothetical protein